MVGSQTTTPDRTSLLVAAFAIAIATLTVYAPVADFPFLSWDDVEYVEQNPNLREPLGWPSVVRAFTEKYESNWIPLTWLSLHLDAAVFGIDPAVYHVENALLHGLTALVLLFAFAHATGRVAPSAFAAAVFVLHPLHVESVAWVAQRKDCLSGLFFALAVAAHLRFAGGAGVGGRLAVFGAGVCAMLSKPTAVMLPVALLLLDFWPLHRLDRGTLLARVREQVPLFAAAGLAGVFTVLAQRSAGSIELLQLPFLWRAMNGAWNYLAYLGMAIWPVDLAFYYTWPLDAALPWKAGIALVAFVALTLAAFRATLVERLEPGGAGRAVWIGWLWYVALLLPVVGFVQVGMQGRADRYMYWPLYGLALAVGYGGHAWVADQRWKQRVAMALAGGVLLALGFSAHAQVHHWRSGLALYGRAVDVTEGNFFAHWALAGELERTGGSGAETHYEQAIRLRPRWFHPHRDYGRWLAGEGEFARAAQELKIAADLQPTDAAVLGLLARVLISAGRPDKALTALDRGLGAVAPNERAALGALREELARAAAQSGARR